MYHFLVTGSQSHWRLKEQCNQLGFQKFRATERLLSKTQYTDVLELIWKECCAHQYAFLRVKMLFSLLAVCKTCSLQSYKYSFKSKEGIVANIQYDVPSLKTLRREKTFFLFSSSLQGSLPKIRKHHNNNKAPAVSPEICGQFQHYKTNSPGFTQIRMQQGRDYISVIWTDKTASSASHLTIWAWMEQGNTVWSTKYFPYPQKWQLLPDPAQW